MTFVNGQSWGKSRQQLRKTRQITKNRHDFLTQNFFIIFEHNTVITMLMDTRNALEDRAATPLCYVTVLVLIEIEL